MALTFPRHMTTPYRWKSGSFSLAFQQEVSQTRGGTPWGKEFAPSIWEGKFTSSLLTAAEKNALLTDLNSLQGIARTGYFHAIDKAWPAAYTEAQAQTLNFSSAVVSSIAGDNQSISLSGLPSTLEISAGDYLTVVTSVGIELYAFAESATASAGAVSDVAVVPAVRSTVAASDSVTMYQPYIEGIVKPNSLNSQEASDFWYRVSFEVLQRPQS